MGELRKSASAQDVCCGKRAGAHVKRGEIYLAHLSPAIGHEQRGTRPVLIVQNNVGNRNSGTTIVAAITSKAKTHIPTHVILHGVAGLNSESCVLLEQLRTIDVSRLGEKVGSLNVSQMRCIDVALAVSLGIEGLADKTMILSLCKQCWKTFYDSGEYILARIDYEQHQREPCTLCNIRTGFDYRVVRK